MRMIDTMQHKIPMYGQLFDGVQCVGRSLLWHKDNLKDKNLGAVDIPLKSLVFAALEHKIGDLHAIMALPVLKGSTLRVFDSSSAHSKSL